MVRVLQVHARYRQAGGEDTVLESEARLLRQAGHDVHQFLAENPPGAGAIVSLAGALWNPVAAARLRRAVAAVSPDVVHVHNTWYSLSPSVVVSAARLGVPVVMTVHNYRLACANALLYRAGAPCRLCLDGSAWNGALHRCYRGFGPSLVAAAGVGVHRSLGTWRNAVDLFLALTEFARGVLVEGGIPGDRVIVKPNFVPDPGRRPAPPSRSETVLFAGRLSEEKGIALLLEAWRRCRPEGLNLTVVGDGPLASVVEGPGVRYLGRLGGDELRRLMLTSRALLVPSQWYEGMPMVVLEAFAAGLPVMAGAIGGIESIVGEAGPEWLVSPPAAGWAEALDRLRVDAAVDRGSERARSIYERRYDPVSALRGLEQAYRGVLR